MWKRGGWCNAVWDALSWLSAPLMATPADSHGQQLIIQPAAYFGLSPPSVASTVHRLRPLSSPTRDPWGAVGPGPWTYYDGSDRSANSQRPAQQCLHRSPKWQCCSQYEHCPSLRRAVRQILSELNSQPKWDHLSLVSNSIPSNHHNIWQHNYTDFCVDHYKQQQLYYRSLAVITRRSSRSDALFVCCLSCVRCMNFPGLHSRCSSYFNPLLWHCGVEIWVHDIKGPQKNSFSSQKFHNWPLWDPIAPNRLEKAAMG